MVAPRHLDLEYARGDNCARWETQRTPFLSHRDSLTQGATARGISQSWTAGIPCCVEQNFLNRELPKPKIAVRRNGCLGTQCAGTDAAAHN